MLAGTVHPFLRVGVELPPVPFPSVAAGARASERLEPSERLGRSRLVESWWPVANAAVSAGAGVIWMSGGPSGARRGPSLACDACTIAAAAVPHVPGPLLGVMSHVPVDRHPALVARDVTALDVLSGGRAAVRLCWAGRMVDLCDGGGGDAPAALEHLGEAVAVCRAVLHDEDAVFEGKHLHVAGAVNRPRPRREDGPPLIVDAPAGGAALARRDAAAAFFVRQVVVGAAAVVCSDDPAEVGAWRDVLDDAAAVWGTSGGPERPAILCRTALRPTAGDAGRDSVANGARALARLRSARAAGAEGVIVRIAGARRDDPAPRGQIGTPAFALALRQRFSPWLS